MSLNNLPPELLDSIFDFLSPSSNPFSNSNLPLYSHAYHPLTLVCKRWNRITTPRLYAAARLLRVKQFSAFSQTLESRNSGQHLRCLRVSVILWTGETKESLLSESDKLLRSLGNFTPNLEELYLAGTQAVDFSWLFVSTSSLPCPPRALPLRNQQSHLPFPPIHTLDLSLAGTDRSLLLPTPRFSPERELPLPLSPLDHNRHYFGRTALLGSGRK